MNTRIRAGLSRRGFLSGLGVGTGGAALAACTTRVASDVTAPEPEVPSIGVETVDFDGPHQAGVATPAQAHLNLIAFNLREGVDKRGLQRLLRLWTEDARRLTQGETPLGSLEPELADTPARLTVTCGFGPTLFDAVGIGAERPEWLAEIPAFSRDQLDERWGQSDLVLQICADDPLTLAHATRHLIRAGVDYARTHWIQQGFLDARGAQRPGQTPRNLFGQKDGTVNPRNEEDFLEQVWIDEGPQWGRGGTMMVVRRVFMNVDTWEILDRTSREVSVGRDLAEGAPLTGDKEFDEPDMTAVDHTGLPIIDPASHMARSRPPADHPEQVLHRRSYNYDLPPEPELSAALETEGVPVLSNSGLVFICFQRDPGTQFIPIQQRLDEADRLNQWITHIGSAVYFIPPGVSPDGEGGKRYWGAALLEA
ncbi:putative deferrochelatase/peroxidase EfeN precursor [Corynebacterium occultum]|uniref:Putative deferrochelatase/peroxidase EfeN n=1 Tax=Corynebacterium occultum TaxID=2675219 RepID=A0A6B8VTR0_9CORY|nr:Dyp-type peroxidase [Corynebacterium occultum]QGU07563.1 putative deferrochelatase/peroxidase EfeN precursor [Corynebacterium occultum]